MFRRQENTIEADPTYPADLRQLGFFINSADQIRMIGAPEKPFEYAATNNDRHNEVRNEALHTCVRKELNERLSKLGIDQYYFPGFTSTKPDGPHVPILAPSAEVLGSRQRLFIVVTDNSQDLGILSYSRLQRDLGINGGSIVGFAKELVKRNKDTDSDEERDLTRPCKVDGEVRDKEDLVPSLVVMNTGQLLYSHKHNQAMNLKSWFAQPRKSIMHNPIRIHERENRVKGHQTPAQHIKTVFDEVVCNPQRVSPHAEIYLVAIGDSVDSVLEVLEGDFNKYGTRIAAMAVIQSSVDDSQIKLPSLRALLHQRTRQWKYTDVTTDPIHCIELPGDYRSGALCPDDKKRPENKSLEARSKARWNERRPSNIALSDVTNAIRSFALRMIPLKKDSLTPKADAFADWTGPSAICPTFAGGNNSTCESVFADQSVQLAILSFFGQVISDPEEFYNTDFKIYSQAPQPTPHSPLALDPTTAESAPDQVEMTHEQFELDVARENLAMLRSSLNACPANIAVLAPGRTRLVEKIAIKEREIARLEERALAGENSETSETQEPRENWNPRVEGPKVPFAGTMIDSELLKAAGFSETAEEELKKLGEKEESKKESDQSGQKE